MIEVARGKLSQRQRGRRGSRAALGVVAVAMSLLAAACSSSASSKSTSPATAGSTGTSAGAPATGTPIKIATVGNWTGPGAAPEALAALKAAASALNADGGIAGHPITVTDCNTLLDPNKAQACYQTYISDPSYVAVLSGVDFNQDAISAKLTQSGLPFIAGGNAATKFQITSPTSFMTTGGNGYAFDSLASAAGAVGAKTVGLIDSNSPVAVTLVNGLKSVLTSSGAKVVSEVPVSATTTDLAPAAAQVSGSNPDVVVLPIGFSQASAAIRALKQSGYKGKIFVSGTGLTDADLASLGVDTTGVYAVGLFPPGDDRSTAWGSLFNQQMDKYSPGIRRDGIALGSWVTLQVLKEATSDLTTFTRATVLAALNADKSVDLGGLAAAPLDFSQAAGPVAGLPRVVNTTWTLWTAKGTKWSWDGKLRGAS